MRTLFFICLTSLCLVSSVRAQQIGYYRQPDIYQNTIVFVAEGDLWTVSREGGAANRLTTYPAEESWPYFSPNGKEIAFRGSYEGGADVYVIPATGGVPKRVTWDAQGRSQPVGWSPDGQIIVKSMAGATLPDYRLSLVHPETMVATPIELSQAAEGSIANDGTLFFARLARQSSNSRGYKGGSAQRIWKFKTSQPEATLLTADYPGTSRQPNVLEDGRVYFLSERTGGMNIWSMTAQGSDFVAHTQLSDLDIQELATDGKTLVYRVGADIWTLDPQTRVTTHVPITLNTDVAQSLVDWIDDPMSSVSDLAISHDGGVVGMVSRGELFVAPVGKGRVVDVPSDSGTRVRNLVFTSDSTSVFGLSDRSGEVEWWKMPRNGIGKAEQRSVGPAMLRNGATPSPNAKFLVHTDFDSHLWLVNLETKSSKKIAEASVSNNVAWSPDSKYVVYSKSGASMLNALHVFDVDSGKTTVITSDRFNDFGPRFSVDGTWLFFTSTRTWESEVGSPWGERAPQPHFDKTGNLYAIPLKVGLRLPTLAPTELNEKSNGEGDVRWDLDHLIQELPVPTGSPQLIGVNAERLFYSESGNLMALDLKPDSEPVALASSVRSVELSGNGKKLLVRKGSKVYVIAASSGKDAKLEESNEVNVSGWKFPVDKRAEWNQIFMDMWRLHRDYFWDPNMGGVDWEGMRHKYAEFLPRVGSREELADLQGMLASELSILHSNAGGGDNRDGTNSVSTASLGGEFVKNEKEGGFELTHVYQSDPDLPSQRSPLADPTVLMETGSIVLEVNGKSTKNMANLGQLLVNQAGKQVILTVKDLSGRVKNLVVTPISGGQEFGLKYHEWEYTRRVAAARMSDDQIGYVHLRAMGSGDIGQWTREFYSQTQKQGMIIDVRHNNGGNIDSWVLSQLLRRPWAYFKGRSGDTSPNMQFSFGGHLVILVDEKSASDGEAVADGFRRLGLGAAVGMRTWGGEIWLSGGNRQVDGGVTRASETGVYGLEGKWLIEGWGFVPDIEVDNGPHKTYHGHDAQLEAAVAYLKAKIAEDPRTKPEPPPYPELIPGYGFPTPWKGSLR